jgi:hypothetical protein
VVGWERVLQLPQWPTPHTLAYSNLRENWVCLFRALLYICTEQTSSFVPIVSTWLWQQWRTTMILFLELCYSKVVPIIKSSGGK